MSQQFKTTINASEIDEFLEGFEEMAQEPFVKLLGSIRDKTLLKGAEFSDTLSEEIKGLIDGGWVPDQLDYPEEDILDLVRGRLKEVLTDDFFREEVENTLNEIARVTQQTRDSLQWVMNWIRGRFDPEDIFHYNDLEEWARNNDFIPRYSDDRF